VEENSIIEESSLQNPVVEVSEATVSAETSEVAAKPAPRRRAPARRRTTKATANPETGVASETLATSSVETPGEPEIAPIESEVTPAQPTVEAPCLVETLAGPIVEKTGPPQHPGILHLKDLIQAAALNLARIDKLTPKLSKQLAKLDASLDKSHKRLRNVKLKEAARAEKYLIGLKEHLTLLAEGEGISSKKIEGSRKGIRSLRQKLSDIKKR
jgi:hypothetical protein